MSKAERALLKALGAYFASHVRDTEGCDGRVRGWQVNERIAQLWYDAFGPDNMFLEQCRRVKGKTDEV